jgi:hypothetical protein
MSEPVPCALCGRPFEPRQLTKHHCLPREKGGTQEHVEWICSQCHGMIHATYTQRNPRGAVSHPWAIAQGAGIGELPALGAQAAAHAAEAQPAAPQADLIWSKNHVPARR